MRAVAWNCRRAKESSALWKYLLELEPDVALLQEVSGIPASVSELFDVRTLRAMGKGGNPQPFSTAILVRGSIVSDLKLSSELPWVTAELAYFAGNLPTGVALLESGELLNLVSVYSPAWPVAKSRLTGVDVTSVKLTQNSDVWVTEILWSALRSRADLQDSAWLIAGDFNSCETFDQWRDGPRGNREFLDRMASLGLTECLRYAQGTLTPTFRKPGADIASCQIDHMFVSPSLARKLVSCSVSPEAEVLKARLSDHLPIIGDFEMLVP